MKKNSKQLDGSIFDSSSEDENINDLSLKKTYGVLEESQKRRASLRLSQQSNNLDSPSIIDVYQVRSSFSETTSEGDSLLKTNSKNNSLDSLPSSPEKKERVMKKELKRKYKELKNSLIEEDKKEQMDESFSILQLNQKRRRQTEPNTELEQPKKVRIEEETRSYDHWVSETIQKFQEIDEYEVKIE